MEKLDNGTLMSYIFEKFFEKTGGSFLSGKNTVKFCFKGTYFSNTDLNFD